MAAVLALSSVTGAGAKLRAGKVFRSGAPVKAARPALARRPARAAAVQTQARTATKQLYICVDCGYIYDGSEGPFEKLSGSYRCPVCAAPKRRFKPYEGKAAKNDQKSMAARARALSSSGGAKGSVGVDEDDKKLFLYLGVGGAVLLGALYFGLSSQF